jgi:hypothetical protein
MSESVRSLLRQARENAAAAGSAGAA